MAADTDDKKVSWSEVGAGGGVGTLILLSVKYKVVDGGLAELLMFSAPFISVASAALYTQLLGIGKEWLRSRRTEAKLNILMSKCDTALADDHLQPDVRQQILSVRNKARVAVIEDTLNELHEHLATSPKSESLNDIKINKSLGDDVE